MLERVQTEIPMNREGASAAQAEMKAETCIAILCTWNWVCDRAVGREEKMRMGKGGQKDRSDS